MANNYRSGYEGQIGQDLDKRGVAYDFERFTLPYTSPVRGGSCLTCGSKKTGKARKYTPDFIFRKQDESFLVVEAKGRFPSTDRSKMRDVKKAYPEMDIRILFQKRSKPQMDILIRWCDKNGFPYAFGNQVPPQWLEEL